MTERRPALAFADAMEKAADGGRRQVGRRVALSLDMACFASASGHVCGQRIAVHFPAPTGSAIGASVELPWDCCILLPHLGTWRVWEWITACEPMHALRTGGIWMPTRGSAHASHTLRMLPKVPLHAIVSSHHPFACRRWFSADCDLR